MNELSNMDRHTLHDLVCTYSMKTLLEALADDAMYFHKGTNISAFADKWLRKANILRLAQLAMEEDE